MTKIKYSLREKKHANTKIILARAFFKCLKSTRFADISIKSVEILEGAFCNH